MHYFLQLRINIKGSTNFCNICLHFSSESVKCKVFFKLSHDSSSPCRELLEADFQVQGWQLREDIWDQAKTGGSPAFGRTWDGEAVVQSRQVHF